MPLLAADAVADVRQDLQPLERDPDFARLTSAVGTVLDAPLRGLDLGQYDADRNGLCGHQLLVVIRLVRFHRLQLHKPAVAFVLQSLQYFPATVGIRPPPESVGRRGGRSACRHTPTIAASRGIPHGDQHPSSTAADEDEAIRIANDTEYGQSELT
jgi:hypothetical protein